MPLSCPNRKPGERPGSGQGQRGAAGGFHHQLAATAAWEVAKKCWVPESFYGTVREPSHFCKIKRWPSWNSALQWATTLHAARMPTPRLVALVLGSRCRRLARWVPGRSLSSFTSRLVLVGGDRGQRGGAVVSVTPSSPTSSWGPRLTARPSAPLSCSVLPSPRCGEGSCSTSQVHSAVERGKAPLSSHRPGLAQRENCTGQRAVLCLRHSAPPPHPQQSGTGWPPHPLCCWSS